MIFFLKDSDNFRNRKLMLKVRIQGVSYWSMQSKSALRGRRINNFVELWCLVTSRGLEIWVSRISFQKSNISCPQQPLTEKVLKSVKNWIFNDPFHKNGPVLVILVPRIIEPSGSVIFLILLPLRADLLCILQYETPCSSQKMTRYGWKMVIFETLIFNFFSYKIEKNSWRKNLWFML